MKKTLAIILSAIGVFAEAYAAQPGTNEDPLVTKSYLGQMTRFNVVEVPQGKSVYGQAGTEMILRQGECTIIGTQKGGVSDVTMGYDLADGITVQGNHLLVVPVNDGRGVKALTNCLIMIKGGYEIR